MGLSDNERLRGIYGVLYRAHGILQDRSERQCDDYVCPRVRAVFNLAHQLWPAFLRELSNGAHWILGSSSSRTILEAPSTPWEVAVVWGCLEDEKRDDSPFDARTRLSLSALVSEENRNLGDVMSIYQEMESLIYYLRRYDDEFRARYSILDDLVSKICGACFAVFAGEPAFPKAYLVREIANILYGPTYPYDSDGRDVVTTILDQHYLHHDFVRLATSRFDIEGLQKHHRSLVKSVARARNKLGNDYPSDLALLDLRCRTVLTLSKAGAEYEHVRRAILDTLRQSPLKAKVKRYESIMLEQAKAHTKQKDALARRDLSVLNPLAVYDC